jgi:hypothetical protein
VCVGVGVSVVSCFKIVLVLVSVRLFSFCVLCGHALQLVWFASSWYVPGRQRSDDCPTQCSAYAPGTDTQSARLAEPDTDCVNCGQVPHASVDRANSSVSQGVHGILPTATLIVPIVAPAQATQL